MYPVLENDRVSVAAFALHAQEQISQLQASSQPKVLTLDGKPSAVVLSVEAYEKIASEAYEHETSPARSRRGLCPGGTGDSCARAVRRTSSAQCDPKSQGMIACTPSGRQMLFRPRHPDLRQTNDFEMGKPMGYR
jgi:PHD/YefM family antitoxin component YafN of YafNO toxin-antitoxin module